ncbi:MAG: hypothetical protein WAK24_06615 [Candidatus Acidiferrales bacterium]
MKTSRLLRAGTAIIAVLAFCFLPHPHTRAQENPSSAHSAGSPPHYINVVHERLKPGRDAAYDGMLSNIRGDYERFNIPAYWIEMKSITGPDESFSLNFGDSFDDLQKMGAGVAAGVAAHPELAGLQDSLLAENTSSVTNFIAERVDTLGFRAATINFAKMRMLQVTVFHVRPGHEGEFAEAAKSIASVYEKVAGSPAWVIYTVHSGAPVPCYLMLTTLSSLKDEDDASARRGPAMEAAGAAVQQRLQEIARSAYDSIETNIYVVNPHLSHMPKDFTAEDPAYWMPKNAPSSEEKSSR